MHNMLLSQALSHAYGLLHPSWRLHADDHQCQENKQLYNAVMYRYNRAAKLT